MNGRLWTRVANLVRRARVSVADAANKVQRITAGGETMEWVEPYGLSAVPQDGAEAVILSTGADQTQGIVVQVGDRRFRPTDLESGEVCVWAPGGNKVKLTADGVVIVVGSGTLQIQALNDAPSAGINSGLVHGSAIEPLTGLTYFARGATTNQVKAEKT